jgi:hypothetical protein
MGHWDGGQNDIPADLARHLGRMEEALETKLDHHDGVFGTARSLMWKVIGAILTSGFVGAVILRLLSSVVLSGHAP